MSPSLNNTTTRSIMIPTVPAHPPLNILKVWAPVEPLHGSGHEHKFLFQSIVTLNWK